MGASEFPNPNNEGMRGIVGSQIEGNRSRVVVVRNSRIYIGTIILISLASAFIGICAVLMAFALIFPISAFTVARGIGAAQWGFSGILMVFMCPFLWKMARKLVHCSAKLDGSGIQFNLGTKEAPLQLSMLWDQINAIQQQRVGNSIQFMVNTADGSYVQFSSYTFLRPKKLARLIANRTGLVIQKI
jgi:hypothetical protein